MFTESGTTFIDTLSSAEDITIQDIADNIGILYILMGIWVFCIGQYFLDARKRKLGMYRDLINVWKNPNLQDLLRSIPKNDWLAQRSESISDRFIHMASCNIAELESIHTELSLFASKKRNVLKNWWTTMKQDHDLVSLFHPSSWDSSIASRRAIFFLAKVLTLLVVCCLEAPQVYLCEGGDDYGAQVEGAFVSDYPDLPKIWKTEGALAAGEEVLSLFYEYFIEILIKTVWTFPAIILMHYVMHISSLVDQIDELEKERILEQSGIKMIHPRKINDLEEAVVAKMMLPALMFNLKRLSKLVRSKGRSHNRLLLKELDADAFQLQDIKDKIYDSIISIKEIISELDQRIAVLAKAEGAFVGEIEALPHIQIATIPKRIHVKTQQHTQVMNSLSGSLGSWKPGGFIGNAVIWLKRKLYLAYLVEGGELVKTQRSRRVLLLIRNTLLIIAMLYLVFCTLYIILYCMQVQDNNVVSSILISIALSDGAEIMITGPITMFFCFGILPAFAVAVLTDDMFTAFQKEKSNRQNGLLDIEEEGSMAGGTGSFETMNPMVKKCKNNNQSPPPSSQLTPKIKDQMKKKSKVSGSSKVKNPLRRSAQGGRGVGGDARVRPSRTTLTFKNDSEVELQIYDQSFVSQLQTSTCLTQNDSKS